LFCSYEIQDASNPILGVFWKALDEKRRGAWAWFHDVFGLAVQKFLNIE
jgi:hypothetical protein